MKQSFRQVLYRSHRAVLIVFMLVVLSLPLRAQQEEILLTFRHPAVGHVYISSLYDHETGDAYIPVLELFNLIEINYQREVKNFTIHGNFITPNNPYSINFSDMKVQLGKMVYELTPAEFRIGETDFFLAPLVFEEIFGLNFTINLNHLVLSLETTFSLPVQERLARERARDRMEGFDLVRENYPLGYKRNRSFLSGTMLDYAITGNASNEIHSLGYTFAGGMELLGGDISGSVYGSNTSIGYNSFHTANLRWRYAILDNNFISGIMAGQMSTTGLQPLSFRGLALTNEPVEPRHLYETYVIDGTTEPDSEVELYINERIADYRRADELGYYRFDVPVTYGTTRISLRIYTPSGELIVTDRQMQVPFTFLPRGVVSYNLQAGQTETYVSDIIRDEWLTHGNVAAGLTRWLTVSAGAQHIGNEFDISDLFYYGSLSARVAKQYLLNIDAAPDHFYRFTGSVMYANNMSINLNWIRFEEGSLFNIRGATDNVEANIYMPFRLFGINTGLRFGGEQLIFPGTSTSTYRADLGARIGRINLRLNYRDNFVKTSNDINFGQGLLTTALTYTIARSPGLPVYVRGMFVRIQNQFDLRRKQFATSELHLSRTVLKTGRLNVGVAYNHLVGMINTQIGLTIDMNRLRSATSINSLGSSVSARQSFNGSIGWDMPNEKLILSNRQQVGRSAASVILFVDNNNSGTYDEHDQLLPYQGVKLDRTTTFQVGRDSILRLSQLQSYYKYNLSVNRNAIADPTLVPIKDKFSFIADPNQYKRIEIPFYRGGIIEGWVHINRNGMLQGIGGLRLHLKQVDGDFEDVIRTFSDGGFYAMDLPPGNYTLVVDPVQLGFLSVTQKDTLRFQIKALADGDYLSDLEIALLPTMDEGTSQPPSSIQDRQDQIELGEDDSSDSAISAPSNAFAHPRPADSIPESLISRDEENQLKQAASEGSGAGSENRIPGSSGEHYFILQAGAFQLEANALALREKLAAVSGFPVSINESDGIFRVRIQGFASRQEAERFRERLKQLGYVTTLVSQPR